ncbi:UDP-sugar pyrophosphorylase [Physcomitrium patens]|uniref:UTP-monosaccharide-1-phosphate uridylyltransferase n=1 Tax=Physcomitrium patens TaxID=3218 RepID=A0A2K1JJF0_PHYPA|nr:UDP-sugar pyrophosphorylase-like [Physcomitrium patens]PNR41649.1 hypothetical protein PHYPA_019054 [Physcomitrium patens]|eukprot:XP_024394251.1 UDP-sugar pyrophosphorylase-like [Physcomitrella patens]
MGVAAVPEAAAPSTLMNSIAAKLPHLSESHGMMVELLLQEGQDHLFQHWQPGQNDNDKLRLLKQVERLNDNYPGGLAAYIHNARKLLADSKSGKNPFEGYIPSVPVGQQLNYGDEEFVKFEEAGVKEANNAVFVLVAGGLGERLGYSGIKIALPSQLTTETCYLDLYIQHILAFQEASGSRGNGIPLVIMTSDDTHLKTQTLLEDNKYFGMSPNQVHLLKQEKVACLADNDARIALDPSDSYAIQTKPHGHGDVHAVLYNSGLLPKWQEEGRKWILFFQDTNGLLFKAIPAALGVSSIRDLDVNSLTVPRKAKEAIGGISRLTHENGSEMVLNVEYNQLDPLLRASGHPDGDVNDPATGYSPFPGNINQLVMKIGPYMKELSRTKGAIVEFVNPKYKDATKTAFKSSTRLECMMQDYPRTLPPSAKVGFSVLDTWVAYAPVKNNPEDAAKIPEGNPKHSPTSGEMAIYKAHCLMLRKAGAQIEDPQQEVFNGQKVDVWPRVIWSPRWALTFADVCKKLSGSLHISQRSTLILDGAQILLEDVSLDGTLVLHAIPETEAKLSNVRVRNRGWSFKPLDYKDTTYPEVTRIRGFEIEKLEKSCISFDQPGSCLVQNVSL